MAAGTGKPSVIRTILIFALLGPLIGYSVFCLWVLVALPMKDDSRPLLQSLGMMLVNFPVGYLIGVIPALVAGALVVASEVRSRATWPDVAVIGLIIGSVFATVIRPNFGIEGLLAVSVGLVPTLICWRLAR